MEDVTNFLNRWNGVYCEVAGSANAKFQCVDLANAYIRDVQHQKIVEWTNAVDFPSRIGDKYEWIPNTPTGVPQEGDLIIWGGGVGHIAIFLDGNVNNFRSFDQNYPTGTPCHVQNHTYKNVLGWLRLKKPLSNVTVPDIEALKRELQGRNDRVQEQDGTIQTLRENLLLAQTKYEDLKRNKETEYNVLKTEYEGYKAQNPPLAGLSLLELIQLYLKKKQG